MNSSIFLRERSRTISKHLYSLVITRTMGGGPRTFPGGLNKWQWKRLHEKKAREKEKKLLDQEQQMYHARVRTERRAKLVSGVSSPSQQQQSSSDSINGPMSPKDHISALADRFMKEGAEDLWNDDDGPVHADSVCLPSNVRSGRRSGLIGSVINDQKMISYDSSSSDDSVDTDNWMYEQNDPMRLESNSTRMPSSMRSGRPSGLIGSPIDVQKLVSGTRNGTDDSAYNENWMYAQNGSIRSFHYSARLVLRNIGSLRSFSGKSVRSPRKNQNSSSDDDDDYGFVNAKWGGLRLKDEKSSTYGALELRDERKVKKMIGSSATLGKLGVKKTLGNESSSNDDDDYRSESGKVKDYDSKSMWEGLGWKDENSSSDGDLELGEKGSGKKMVGSSAALGKYDAKKTRRVPMKAFDEVDDFSEQVQFLKHELNKKNLMEKEAEMDNLNSLPSEKRFDECGVSPLTVKALSAAGFVQMTKVQEATLSVALEGKDALVKANTGSGKSLAFLLPAIEAVLKATCSTTNQRASPICVLILSPTRELASQIAAEATVMVKHHDGIGVQTLIGGTRFKVDQRRLESEPCQIIVATPGRLLDHVENKSGFSARLMKLKMLIVDEADHLLDLGFRKDMETIVDCLPRSRQSLLFSATLPKEVRRISQLVLKKEHAYVDTIHGCVETPTKVKQSYLIAPHEQHFHILHHILKEHMSQVVDYKVIIFCSTAMVTSLMYLLLREMRMNVRDIHSRKPQIYRTKISEEFKESQRIILVTSDVTMTYPDVTLVVQVGLPSDREQYIRRLGRTGREDKDGEGALLLAPWEEYFLDEVKSIPIEKSSLPNLEPNMKLKLDDSMTRIDTSVKEAAYHAWLGHYNSIREIGRDKTTLVELANKFGESIGLQIAPSMFRKTAIRMGLKDIPGIRIRK